MKRRHAFLSFLKRVAVELDRIAIRQRLAGHVLEHIARLAQRARQIREQLIVARCAFKRACRRIERIDGAPLTRKQFVGAVRRRHERFGVFRLLETRGKLLVFPFVGNADRIDALESETGLVEPCRRRFAGGFYTRKLVSGALCRIECRNIVGVSLANRVPRPSVEQGEMRCRTHEGLVLMLATQIERRRDKAGNFLRACHVAVDRRTRAAVDADAAANDRLAIFELGSFGDVGSIVEEEAAFDRQAVRPFANCGFIGALANKELACRKKCRLSRSRFAGDRSEPARRGKGRVSNERHITDMDFVDHRISLFQTCPAPRGPMPGAASRKIAAQGTAA